jgi:hypothetical protein
MTIGFATHGELLNMLYLAFGVMPRKEDRADGFDEKNKKTLQTQLRRLAGEQGSLVENYEQARKDFHKLIAKYLTLDGHDEVLFMLLKILARTYADIVRVEGSFLEKKESIRYFIITQAVPAFVLTLQESVLRVRPASMTALETTELYWYLPSWDIDGVQTTPLTKVINWAYSACGLTHHEFHYPAKNSGPGDAAWRQNRDNASKWRRGKALPSLPALIVTFKESFEAQRVCGKQVDSALQESVLTALVYARLASFLAREAQLVYGESFLQELCCQIATTTRFLRYEGHEFIAQITPVLNGKTDPHEKERVWQQACTHHQHFMHDKQRQVQTLLLAKLDALPGAPFDPSLVQALTRKFGAYAVYSMTERIRHIASLAAPPDFARLLYRGFAIREDRASTLADIDTFVSEVGQAGLTDALAWLIPWLRGAWYYRQDDFPTAFRHYETAFGLAKYAAGANQYKLVNQFVELAAKTDNAVAFRQGVDWATYLGLEIRWLRGQEATPEALKATCAIMKRANYSHQL